MTFGYAIISMLEAVGFVLIVLGLVFEQRIAAWEEKMIKRLRVRLFGRRKGRVVLLGRSRSGDKVG